MAKTKAPLLGFDALGSVAKETTYSKWKGQNYAKQYKAPGNPKTTAQILARDTLSNANSLWRDGPALFKEAWGAFATRKVLTGYNAWIGRYIGDTNGDSDILQVVVAPKVNGGLTLNGIIVTPISLGFDVTFDLQPLPSTWIVEAVFACTFQNGPTANLPETIITAGQDLVAPYLVTLSGLAPGIGYGVFGWIRYAIPNGITAYGQSLPPTGAAPLA